MRGIEPDPVPEYFTKGKLLHQLIARDYSIRHGLPPAYEDEVAQQFSGENLAHLLNALALHRQHAWHGVEVVGVEHPFVMQLCADLPPVVGVIDLVLEADHESDLRISLERSGLQSLSREGEEDRTFILVDHKTGRNFYPDDELQVAIYARYISSAYGGQTTRLFYDHYRWVNNLGRIRKPAFQRVEVRADPARWPRDLARIRRAYGQICAIREGGSVLRCGECYRCPYRGMCR